MEEKGEENKVPGRFSNSLIVLEIPLVILEENLTHFQRKKKRVSNKRIYVETFD